MQERLLALYAAAISLPAIEAPENFREGECPSRPEGWPFETHWGDHAIDALRALHRACLRSASD